MLQPSAFRAIDWPPKPPVLSLVAAGLPLAVARAPALLVLERLPRRQSHSHSRQPCLRPLLRESTDLQPPPHSSDSHGQ